MLRIFLGGAALLGLFGWQKPARAVDYFWTNSNGGAYDEPSHWTPFAPPAIQGPGGANDTVNFDLGAASSNRYVVTDAGRENSQLIVHNDSLELTIFVSQEFSSVGGANPSLVVGAANGDTGDLILSSGGASVLETRVTSIGDAAGSTGVLTVDNLQWNGTGNIRVGHLGSGTLTLQNGSDASSANGFIGNQAGSTGVVNIVDNATWTASGEIAVGRFGEGDMTIDYGGSVTSNSAVIGEDAAASGTVFVNNNATWMIAESLTVGEAGSGIFANTFGDVVCHDAFIARLPGSIGGAHTSNNGTTWIVTGRLSLAGDAFTGIAGGLGFAAINPGGLVDVAEDVVIFPDGQFDFRGGTLDSPIITVRPGGAFNWTGGELFVDTFDGNLSNNGGTLAARDGSNSILVTGEYLQASDGTLSLEIAGDTASNQYDKLTVGNTAFLGGVLQVDLADGFQPGASDLYVVVDALNFGSGSFDNVANGERLFLNFSAGSFLVNYGAGSPFDPSQVVLSDFQPVATGDFDFDHDVDGRDFLIWQRGGSPNPFSASDLAAWQANYGAAPLTSFLTARSAAEAASPVPEPTFSSLLAFNCLVGITLCGRLRRHQFPSH